MPTTKTNTKNIIAGLLSIKVNRAVCFIIRCCFVFSASALALALATSAEYLAWLVIAFAAIRWLAIVGTAVG